MVNYPLTILGIFLIVCTDFCLNTERKFYRDLTKTVKDNVKGFVIHFVTANYLFSKTKETNKQTKEFVMNDLHTPSARADDSTLVIPLLSAS